MFGGWDGSKNLNDFWEYDENLEEWTCLSPDTSKYFFFIFVIKILTIIQEQY